MKFHRTHPTPPVSVTAGRGVAIASAFKFKRVDRISRLIGRTCGGLPCVLPTFQNATLIQHTDHYLNS